VGRYGQGDGLVFLEGFTPSASSPVVLA
jgi:hypothetical protein